MKPLTHEKKLAIALEQLLRESEHMRSHGFKCPSLDYAIEAARKALKNYLDD